jgi:hypothetical protein
LDAYKCKSGSNIETAWHAYKSSSDNEILCLCHTPIFGLNMPLPFRRFELRTGHHRFERTILLDIENLVHMVEVSSKFLIIRVVGSPCPIFVDLWPRKLILRYLRVNSGSGIAIPAPSSAEVGASFIKDYPKTMFSECFETENTTWD